MKQSIHQHAKARPTLKSVTRTPAPAAVGAGLPAILHTTAFNSPRARNRTTPTPTPLRGEGRGAGAIPPSPSRGEGLGERVPRLSDDTPIPMRARPASGDNT